LLRCRSQDGLGPLMQTLSISPCDCKCPTATERHDVEVVGQSETSRSRIAELRAFPCASSASERVTQPPRIRRSRWFCSRWQKRAAVPRRTRDSPHAAALSHCLNLSWQGTNSGGRRWLLQPVREAHKQDWRHSLLEKGELEFLKAKRDRPAPRLMLLRGTVAPLLPTSTPISETSHAAATR
jgi:hypothetical protein